MARVRWHHFFFLLAILDVAVIVVSLEWHRHTLLGVEALVDESSRLDVRRSWLERVQKGILELGAPGNEIFSSQKVAREQEHFDEVREEMAHVLRAGPEMGLQSAALETAIQQMVRSSQSVFQAFTRMLELDDGSPERHALYVEASRHMAQLDRSHMEAMRALGTLGARNSGEQTTLLQKHEAELQRRVALERYFIAAVVMILLGLVFLGRRMQQADRELELQRRRVAEERRERLAAIGELCSSVAHGIRNPLAAIRSSAQLMLEQNVLDDDARLRLQDVLAEARRLGDRVTGLLNLSRTNAAAFGPVSLRDVASSAVRELRPELDRLGFEVQLDLSSSDVVLEGDRRQLEQVVIELVSNAMEHAPAGGRIAVRCHEPNGDGRARLVVEDNGPGVPRDARKRIFDLFYTTKPSGTGIGLATVMRITRLHSGEIHLDCPSGGGARFTVALPVTRNGHEAESAAAETRPTED